LARNADGDGVARLEDGHGRKCVGKWAGVMEICRVVRKGWRGSVGGRPEEGWRMREGRRGQGGSQPNSV